MLTIDIETTGLDWNSKIVLVGCLEDDKVIITEEPDTEFIYSHRVLIGHNIKYDLHKLRQYDEQAYIEWVRNGGIVYDTQIAEYMLSGQWHKYPTLDDLSAKYGGTQKDERVKDMFESGMGADEVPIELLKPYLEQDVRNTYLIYKKQREQASRQFWRLFKVHMDFLLFLEECEFNGMKIDLELTKERVNELAEKERELLERIESLAGIGFNPASSRHLACWLYGGTLDLRYRVCVGVYKTGARKGQPRYKWETETKGFPKRVKGKPKTTAKGNIVVDEKTLQKHKDDELISLVMELRKIAKEKSTYYENFLEMQSDGIIHHTLNQCSTSTGRVSSTHPNLQNVKRGAGVKDVFIPRRTALVEVDFSQLEVVVLGHLSQDPMLVEDIVLGRDMHTIRARELYNVEEPTKEQRTHAKVLSFQLQYGSGAKNMADTWGLPYPLCQKFIDLYYKRYKRVKQWQDEMIDLVKHSHPVEVLEIVDGWERKRTVVETCTGRRLSFCQYETPDFIEDRFGFSPTEIKNYFVQSMATADIVPLFCGLLVRKVIGKELLINTVHDSVLADVNDVEWYVQVVEELLAEFPNHIRYWLDKDWDLPLNTSLERGERWSGLKAIRSKQ